MKVWINQLPNKSAGGLYRVVQGLIEYLPKYGIEVTEDIKEADVAHCHISTFGAEIDLPLVVSSHGLLWEDHKWGKLAEKVNTECLESYRRAEVVTAPSNFVARAISRHTLAQPLVVHHGIDANKWLPGGSKGYVVWNKARRDPANDPEEMHKLAELASDIKFYSTLGRETSNVTITGKIDPDKMVQLIQDAGVYLDTPLESGGPCFGVLEAMACAVPTLAWNFGGNAESIIHKVTGYLAEPYNYDDLLKGLYYCLEHRHELGLNAFNLVVDHYSMEQSILGYVKAYEKALEKHETKVAVVVPCYNLGEFLPYCLDSVLEQDYDDFKVVVINDASADNSLEIMKNYAEKDDRIKIIDNKINLHVSASRNKAINFINSKYILPLDADDRLEKGAIRAMAEYLDTHKNTDIVAGKLHIYHESDLNGNHHEGGWPNNTSLELQLKGHNRLPYASMYTRKLYDRTGGYRTRIRNGVEDADFWTRALSYGYKAHLLDKVTLKYTHRENSLGKVNDKGASAWLDWFPWTFKDCPAVNPKVKSFYPPEVSVVVPVGPGHEQYIQTCLDSLLAQTNSNWEVILVNDTGKTITAPSFAHIINYEGNRGVAYARNRGVKAALADKIIFLDVDDVAQPLMIDVLLASYKHAGGWIYGDWFINKGSGKLEYSESEDWNYDKIIQRSLGPITGLYLKRHILAAGGFEENAPGWEDWDFHLKLLQKGICGTRVEYPLITYNMHLGKRREDNFKNHKKLIQYIHERHNNLRKKTMGCRTCGGKRTVVIESNTSEKPIPDTVLLRYLGNESKQRITSKTHKGTQYQINKNKPITLVFKDDVAWLMNKRKPDGSPLFELIEDTTPAIVKDETILVSDEMPSVSFEDLHLEDKILNLLKANFSSPEEVKNADDSKILAVRGIGPARLEEIRKALW